MVLDAIQQATVIVQGAGITAGQQAAIKDAITLLRARLGRYQRYKAYYDDRQPLTYASTEYKDIFSAMVAQYRENMCPAVVNSLADRLIVNGFDFETDDDTAVDPGAEASDEQKAQAKKLGALAWQLWRRNRMDARAGQVHKEAIKCGDAYVTVFPDEAGRARIDLHDTCAMVAHYDSSEAGRMDWAAKWWMLEDKRARLNIYYDDRIEKFVTKRELRGGRMPDSSIPEFVPWADEPVLFHQLGRVPVFHFANDADNGEYGVSELKDVLPIQDALNKSVADLLVGAEFGAYPQRWVTGMQTILGEDGQPIKTFKPGVDRLWVAENPNAGFGEFSAMQLTGLLDARSSYKDAIADVTGTPAHYLRMRPSGDWPSGESLKTAEARFVAKIVDRQKSYGNVWEDVVTLAAQIENLGIKGRLSTLWHDASPRSELDAATTAVAKKQIGVSDEQLQRELGYSDEQIAKMATESAAAAESAVERQMQAASRFSPREDEE